MATIKVNVRFGERKQRIKSFLFFIFFSNSTRAEAQMLLNCCGFDQKPSSQECIKVILKILIIISLFFCSIKKSCFYFQVNDLQCCSSIDSCDCLLCKPKIVKAISKGLDLSGAVGLIFSFTEVNNQSDRFTINAIIDFHSFLEFG